MGDKSKIEWTEATWNPVVGCAKVSEGCRNCYAMKVAHRLAAMGQERYEGLTEKRSSGVEWNGTVRIAPEALDIPRRWTRPRRIFVNSMSDLFHPDVPFQFIEGVFVTMKQAPQHTFQILTKRPERMLEYLTAYPSAFGDPFEPLPNVWLGVSVEDQKSADERIPLLLQVPAAVRWLSMEPLLGPVDISNFMGDVRYHWNSGHHQRYDECEEGLCTKSPSIDWVVVGGESGHKARPMRPDWARSLRDQCTAAGTPFFFKQWGDVREYGSALPGSPWIDAGHDLSEKKGGRILDGRTWDETPEA